MTVHQPGKHAVMVVFVTVLIDMMGFGIIMPALPKLIRDVSHQDLAAASIIGGWLFFAYGGIQFLFGTVIGNLSDAIGRRPVLLLSLLGMMVDYMLTAFAPNLVWLFVGRVFAGLCGASYTTANAYLADITEASQRARAFGLMGAAFGLGFIIGPAVGGIAAEYGPRVPFFVAAAVAGANLVYGYFALPETLSPERRRPFSLARSNPIGALLVFRRYPGVLPMCLVLFFYTLSTSVYPAIWPYWSIARFGWSELVIGLTLSFFGLCTAIVQGFLTGPIVKRLGEWTAVLIGITAEILASFGYGLAPGMTIVLILFIVHAPEGLVHPALSAMMSNQAPSDAQGEIQGGIASVQSIAMLIGTVFFTQLFGYFTRPDAIITSPSIPLFVTGAMAIATLLYFLAACPRKRANPQ